jgi:hypothetical protein
LKRFENKCYLFISITKENGSSFGEKKNAHWVNSENLLCKTVLWLSLF